jgi:hypothetical protein
MSTLLASNASVFPDGSLSEDEQTNRLRLICEAIANNPNFKNITFGIGTDQGTRDYLTKDLRIIVKSITNSVLESFWVRYVMRPDQIGFLLSALRNNKTIINVYFDGNVVPTKELAIETMKTIERLKYIPTLRKIHFDGYDGSNTTERTSRNNSNNALMQATKQIKYMNDYLARYDGQESNAFVYLVHLFYTDHVSIPFDLIRSLASYIL